MNNFTEIDEEANTEMVKLKGVDMLKDIES